MHSRDPEREPMAAFACRALLACLQRARRLVPGRDPGDPLREAALRAVVQRGRALARVGGVTLHLQGHRAALEGCRIYADGPDDDLVASLTALGVGALELTGAVDEASLHHFGCALAEHRDRAGTPESDVVARLAMAGLSGIRLLPARRIRNEAAAQRPHPWSLLPSPPQPPAAAEAAARELQASLPAQLARRLLQDLTEGLLPGDAVAEQLTALLGVMLDRGDAAGAACLLHGARTGAGLEPAVTTQLERQTILRLGDDLAAACLAAGAEQVQGLVALCIDLGSEAVAACLGAAELLTLPEARGCLATLAAAAPAALEQAIQEGDLALLPHILRAAADGGVAMPLATALDRLRLAQRIGLGQDRLQPICAELSRCGVPPAVLQPFLTAAPGR